MTRHALLTAAALAALSMGCGAPMDTDAGTGTDAGPDRVDSGPGTDAGYDGGARRDGGPTGCNGAGCEFVELDLGMIHSCGRRANGEVMCWGYNQDFQLGDNRLRHEMCNEVGRPPSDCSGTPVNVRYDNGGAFPLVEDATSLAIDGFSSSCALRSGQMWCWSNATVPDVAGGVARTRQVAELANDLTDIQSASVTGGHACVIQGAGGNVLCVGRNILGQLGRGPGTIAEQVVDYAPVIIDATTTPPTELTGALQVAIAMTFSCARTATDVYCWGNDASDQMGDANETTASCALSATDIRDCAPDPRVVGGTADPLGEVAEIAIAGSHACAIQSAPGTPGPVVCWGDNRLAQSGQPRPDEMTNESLDTPMTVPGLANVVQIALSGGNGYALHTDGTISAWGFNDRGQLGDGSADHGLRCTSGDSSGDCTATPVTVATIDDATFIAANHSHACAIRADGSVWCWGLNRSRQLGDGTRETRSTPVMVQGTIP